MKLKKTILLTGAGFTKNFGGFLAQEMWTHIFNDPEVQQNEDLRNKLINNFDYESVYESVKATTREDERNKSVKILESAILNAYIKLDEIIKNEITYIDHYKLDFFINRFSGDKNMGKGFIFTLNQDLFVERQYINGKKFVCPGIKYPCNLNDPLMRRLSLPKDMYITISSQKISTQKRKEEIEAENSFYIKLHGSFNWRDSDLQQLIITGQSKSQKIKMVGLLDWYWDMLKDILKQGTVKLLIIGYGFRDIHLNKLIEQAVLENNLKLYIISPNSPRDTQLLAKKKPISSSIRKRIKRLFSIRYYWTFPNQPK